MCFCTQAHTPLLNPRQIAAHRSVRTSVSDWIILQPHVLGLQISYRISKRTHSLPDSSYFVYKREGLCLTDTRCKYKACILWDWAQPRDIEVSGSGSRASWCSGKGILVFVGNIWGATRCYPGAAMDSSGVSVLQKTKAADLTCCPGRFAAGLDNGSGKFWRGTKPTLSSKSNQIKSKVAGHLHKLPSCSWLMSWIKRNKKKEVKSGTDDLQNYRDNIQACKAFWSWM